MNMVKPFPIIFLVIAPILCKDFNKCGILNPDSNEDINAPWLAAVGRYKSETSEDEMIVSCSGSILNNRYIVTAAHCFQRKQSIPKIVRIGGNRINLNYSHDKKIKDVKKHPKFNFPVYYFDVALIVVEGEIEFSARISSICLPQTTSDHPGEDLSITVQGWGQDPDGNSAKKVSETSYGARSRDRCDYKFSNAEKIIQGNAGKIYQGKVNTLMPQLSENILFCADSDLSTETGVCRGDSGGAAIRK